MNLPFCVFYFVSNCENAYLEQARKSPARLDTLQGFEQQLLITEQLVVPRQQVQQLGRLEHHLQLVAQYHRLL